MNGNVYNFESSEVNEDEEEKVNWETTVENNKVKEIVVSKNYVIKSNNENQMSLNINNNNFTDDVQNDANANREGLIKQITEKVGKNNAYDEFIEFELKNNKILVEGKEVANGYDEDSKKLQISFEKKDADNPKINAILIVRGTLKDTDYDEYQRGHELLEKQKQELEKKNREFQRMSKSIDFEDFEDDFTDDGKKYRVSNGIFSGQSIFITLIGIGFVYYLFFSKKR